MFTFWLIVRGAYYALQEGTTAKPRLPRMAALRTAKYAGKTRMKSKRIIKKSIG
ncbi:hypothetical protein P9A16_21745 [Shinella sp. 838]|uniref:hypothetical protein n=1 Tax=unclassified Shinella TaxID=2643062 RepID=UPI0012DF316B|nr:MULTISPECIES: hypothetical protein [unclassified Shinella]MCA0340289.1 hypothetical protein [Pseudomonadota bacterium]MDG4673747.1 hypothetical protein [Shinella sp. 838]